jgi:hypothetical protein
MISEYILIQIMGLPILCRMPESNGKYEDPGETTQLYGGVIGEHHSLLKNIDMCVAASRVGSAYPWFINRPPRDTSNRW